MGLIIDYPDVPAWTYKDTGYQAGAMVQYKGNVFIADFWAGAAPGERPKPADGWALYDELYDLTPVSATPSAKVIAYIPTWRKREGFRYDNDEMYRHITHGIVSFLTFSESQLGQFDATSLDDVNAVLAEVVSTAHRHSTKAMVALGGANDYGFQRLMTAIGGDERSPLLEQAVARVVGFVRDKQLDGVDLDLECWWDPSGDPAKDQGGRLKADGPHPAGKALSLFARRLKAAMPDKVVSAAVFATSWYGNNYDAGMARDLDWLGIMAYDLTGSWNASPVGPHAALYKIRDQEKYAGEQHGAWPGGGSRDNPIHSVEDAIWYWSNPFYINWQGAGQNVPRNKIVIGAPLYGYDFASAKSPDEVSGLIAPGYKSVPYAKLVADHAHAASAPGGNIKLSGSTSAPAFTGAGPYRFSSNIYFDTPALAAEKLQFAKRLGMQGVMVWELSNDVWDDGKSIVKSLYAQSGDHKPPAAATGGQRYDQLAAICTHNAFVNYDDTWGAPAQSTHITDQMNRGVRALMLDTHYAAPSGADVFKIIKEKGIYLLHGVNEHGWLLGTTYPPKPRRLSNALDDVVAFLKKNPREIITLFLEDYSNAEQMAAELTRVSGLAELIYDPDNDPVASARAKRAWPLVSDMIQRNKRLVIFSSKNHDNPKNKLGVAFDQHYTKQNYWSLGAGGGDRKCQSRWNNGSYDVDYVAPPLFLMSHFRDTPTIITAAIDNAYDNLMSRAEKDCFPLTRQLPNFVAVDFWEYPLGGDDLLSISKNLTQKLSARP